MIDRSQLLAEVFIASGIVRVSDAALQMARAFSGVSGAGAGGHRIVTFDWAQSIAVGDAGGAPPQEVGPCLILGAYERADVPPDSIARVGQFEYAVRMPREVLAHAVEQLIDADKSAPFGLVFR